MVQNGQFAPEMQSIIVLLLRTHCQFNRLTHSFRGSQESIRLPEVSTVPEVNQAHLVKIAKPRRANRLTAKQAGLTQKDLDFCGS